MTQDNATERERLLPCPFCGGEASRDDSYEVGVYYGCHECGIWRRGLFAWNSRSATTPVNLTGGILDTLIALVEKGPLWDGDVPSKAARDELVKAGYAVRIMFKCSDGYQAATYAGRDAYCKHFGSADTVSEARSNRYAAQVINRIKRK